MEGAETINNENLIVYYMYIVANSLRLFLIACKLKLNLPISQSRRIKQEPFHTFYVLSTSSPNMNISRCL